MPLFLGLHGTFLSDINIDMTADHLPSGSALSATHGCRVQRPGWDRLHWKFTVSERAVCQASNTRLGSYDGVSAAHHPRARLRAKCFQRLEAGAEKHPVWNSGWLGAAACLNRFRGFCENIHCNALMNPYFHPPLDYIHIEMIWFPWIQLIHLNFTITDKAGYETFIHLNTRYIIYLV